MSVRRAVVIDIVRSPFCRGRIGGALHGMHPVDLYAQVLQGLLARTQVPPDLIEDVITGCVLQVAEQAGNIGRQAALAAGLPVSVPAVTLDRKCGSAQQAVDFSAQGVIAGAYDAVIAGGIEMMSTVPMRSNRLGKDNLGLLLKARYPDGFIGQGISAELIAARWHISRSDMDEFSAEQKKYLEGFASGLGIARPGGAGTKAPPAPPAPTGPESPHHEARARAIAAGGKLVVEEKAKAEKHPFEMWDEMRAAAAAGKFPKGSDVFLYKYHGMFHVAQESEIAKPKRKRAA